jgi:hypothetical protein
LQFEKPKLQAIALHSEDDLAVRLERGMQASSQVIEERATQVIPPPQAKQVTEAEPPDHSAPFAQNTKHRFRRF